jgi:hypothetical protein
MRINLRQTDIKQYFPDITDALGREIPAFMTERECRAFAVEIGWGACDIIRIDKRFERVYVAGRKHLHNGQDACGNILEQMYFPTGQYQDGNMQVIEIKKVI